jgi:oligoendopeptidase F
MLKTIKQQWDLDSIFKGGADSNDLCTFLQQLETDVSHAILDLQKKESPKTNDEAHSLNSIISLFGHLKANVDEAVAYSVCLFRQNTSDKKADAIRERCLKLKNSLTLLLIEVDRLLLETPNPVFYSILEGQHVGSIAFFLQERRNLAKKRLAPEFETIIEKMNDTGAKSWSRLRQKMIQRVNFTIDIDGKEKNVTGKRALHMMFTCHPDPEVRTALQAEFQESIKNDADLFAHALNQIIESNLQIQRFRGYDNVLSETLQSNRLLEDSLTAMRETLNKNLSRFTPYFERKSKLLGMDKLGEVDLLATLGGESVTGIKYEEALKAIVDLFGSFSPEMANFARKAIDNHWIDVEDRSEKSFIEFNTYFPLSNQSRIMTRFHGSFHSVATLAHELGHAYHNHELSKTPLLNQDVPLSMAEISSTFTEILVTNGFIESVGTKEEKIALLDEKIKNMMIYIFKPYVNFLFLNELYEESKKGVLSSVQLNALMVKTQKFVYQDSLRDYTPSEWISNNLFWLIDRPFYNYQYTFGYLFSAGIFALVEKGDFSWERYSSLLQDTGCMNIEDLAIKNLGVDLTTSTFWQRSLDLLLGDIDEFLTLTQDI